MGGYLTLPGSSPSLGESGAAPVQVYRQAFDATDPDLAATGVVISDYTPALGDLVLAISSISVLEAFDGDDPWLYVAWEGADVSSEYFGYVNATAEAPEVGVPWGKAYNLFDGGDDASWRCDDDTPLIVKLATGDGSSDPESTVGSGEVVLVVVPAPDG